MPANRSPGLVPIRRALISVSDKDFFGTYSPAYISNGWEEFQKLQKGYQTLGHGDRLKWVDTPLPHGLVYLPEFLGSQILVLTPVVAAVLAWGLWVGVREGLVRRREPAQVVLQESAAATASSGLDPVPTRRARAPSG
jgi:hypothetical protein